MSSSRLLRIALLTSTIWLAGCATTSSCPPLPEYSPLFREELAKEIEQMPQGSAVLRAMEDYYVLRQQVKACR